MTLPTGNSRNKESHCGRAFTLIELMLVMTMLVAVIAVTMPSLSNFFRGRSLDSEARRFLSLTRYGQERAVSEGLPMTLWIDTANGTYGLREEPGYNENDPKAVSFGLGKDLQIAVVNSARAQQTGRSLTAIRFLPDGSVSETSPLSVQIRQSEDDSAWIGKSRNGLSYEIQNQNTALQNARR